MSGRGYISYYLQPAALPSIVLTFEQKSVGAAGWDLHANISRDVTLDPGDFWSVRTGLHLAMPLHVHAEVRPRSGLARDHQVVPILGTIDADYRGEISVNIINHHKRAAFTIKPGMRIAQIVFSPVLPFYQAQPMNRYIIRAGSLAELGESERGSKGFGSTGLM